TGREAVAILQKTRPVMAILDVGLPQMFGFEVCDIIKRNEALKKIKVLLVAAIHSKTTYHREPSNLYGADDFIERQSLEEELVDKVRSLLARGDSPGPHSENDAMIGEPPVN
ncbi:MAG: response regulator, partial [Armatimonadetes bacterium]|nr:response regulator [Armatimonadota bacterium]NIO97109.1 response regulator [Armatimonadota bacterium]